MYDIAYDPQGNPINMSLIDFEWQNGIQLEGAYYTQNGVTTEIFSYTYD